MASFLPFRRAPSASLLSSVRTPHLIAARFNSDSSKPPFGSGPAPPRLPKEEQEIFEQLQRQSTGAFSTPRETPRINQSPDSEPQPESQEAQVNASESGDEMHPDLRMGEKPEFAGDTNPMTGEVGGPKTNPLRWGAESDWSYNGRVTDF